MPPEAESHSLAREWLRRARSNLALAQQPKPPEAVWEDLCFDAHQAAEKAVKAVLVRRQIDFPYIHDIGQLLTLLDPFGASIPADLWERADELMPHAVLGRYPGAAEPVAEPGYRDAVQLAERFVRWAEEVIGGA